MVARIASESANQGSQRESSRHVVSFLVAAGRYHFPVTFLHAAFLFGLAVLAIPPVVHLLNRRKLDVIEWGATMFLPAAPDAKRRLRFEHFPLMLLRMGLLALLALAFAGPQFRGCHARLPERGGARDVVILIDGSASMTRGTGSNTPSARAAEYVRSLLDRLDSQARVAIFAVKQRPVPLLENFTADRQQSRNALELVPRPSGIADWPAAIQQAFAQPEGDPANRELLVLTDDQRFGWADAETNAKWSLLAQVDRPRVHVVTFPALADVEGSNAGLEPIRAERTIAVAGREITFRSAMRLGGSRRPTTVRISVDGAAVNTLNLAAPEGDSPAAFSFSHRFDPGSHLVSFELSDDSFTEDNRQDFALEVLPSIPVLIVDGGAPGERHASDFLRDALAPMKDTAPAFIVRTVSVSDWQPGLLSQNVRGPNTVPRAVVLANIDKLSAEQSRQIERYTRDGGSVLATLGERCDAAAWNRIAFRGGEGFLPARILGTAGDVSPKGITEGVRPQPASFAHPAMEIFKEPLPGGLATAYFPKYWKLDPNAGIKGSTGTTIAALTNRDPWLVERSFGSGRVILSAHPLDDSWKTNLHRLPDFVRLAHELLYSLTGTRSAQRNLQPSQPLIFAPSDGEPPGEISLRMPDGRHRAIPVPTWPAIVEGTGEPGAYQLTTQSGRHYWYAMGYDPRESDFTANSPADRERIAATFGTMKYWKDSETIDFGRGERLEPREFWWWILLLVLGVLSAEAWMTRRLVKSGEHAMAGEADAR